MINTCFHYQPFKFISGIQEYISKFITKREYEDHLKDMHKKNKRQAEINNDEYIISQVFHYNFFSSE
jgi:hypothetical protein